MKHEYYVYWSQKGDYGKERIRRAYKRKEIRKAKPRQRRWEKRFQCEMGYWDCEQRGWCNGDC